MRDIVEVGTEVGLRVDEIEPRSFHHAKVRVDPTTIEPPSGAYVLVTGITPTPAGEGKTVTSLGLGMALRQLGKRAVITLRQSSVGPTLGSKGGGAGGGAARVEPLATALLGLGDDLFAVETANNLLASWADAQLTAGDVTWRRVVDMNDRALRRITTTPSARRDDPRVDTGFDVTAASEITAIVALAADRADLRRRLDRVVVGFHDDTPVTAGELGITGALMVLLRDAFVPNLLQTAEGGPVLVHGGPFANIAHGCSSVVADRIALARAEVVVTEAGFGADLGAEKFLHLKAPIVGRGPDVVVLVATVRALAAHGGRTDGGADADSVRAGSANLVRHVANLRRFGAPVVVAVNRFPDDTPELLAVVEAEALDAGAFAAVAHDGYVHGGAGCLALGEAVLAATRTGTAPAVPIPLFAADAPLADKVHALATGLYGAADVAWSEEATATLERLDAGGLGRLPVCMAKTHRSFSHDPALGSTPSGFTLPVRGLRLAAGAGFVTVLLGDILTMPGLPARPRFLDLDLADDGTIVGLA